MQRLSECPRFEADDDGKKCKHYARGKCRLVNGAHCVEWLRKTGKSVPATHPIFSGDLFVGPTIEIPDALAAMHPGNVDASPETSSLPGLETSSPMIRDEDIASLKRLNVEIGLTYPFGEVWIVPEYTRSSRNEISVQDAATLARLLHAFPNSRICAFRKLGEDDVS